MESSGVDVVIIGGGLAGSTLAIQLLKSKPTLKVSVVDRVAGPLPEAAFKVGESTVEVGGHYFSHVLGLEAHLQSKQLRKFGFRYFFNGDRTAIEKRLELGGMKHPPTGSWQIDRGRFETFLREKVVELGGEYIAPGTVKDVELNESAPHTVRVEEKGGKSSVISTRWVVDATGRNGFLKRRLELGREIDHKCSSGWFRVKGRLDVSDWSDSTEWKSWEDGTKSRWYSTNHLMGEGYWVWLIPLSSDFTSVGIVAAEPTHEGASFSTLEKSIEWLEKFEPQCAAKLKGREIVDFLFLKNFSYGAKQLFSSNRWALTGEAGVFLDPFYSPGSDFIAIGNTYIVDLVLKDLNSEPIEARSVLYNQIFLEFFDQMLLLYKDQYPIFGNSVVMPLKVVWDYAVYWTFIGALFFESRLTDFRLLSAMKPKLDGMRGLHAKMQQFFREWAKSSTPCSESGSLSFFRSDYLIELNRQLSMPGSASIDKRLSENIDRLVGLANEMCEFAAKNGASLDLVESVGVSPREPVLNDFLSDLGGVLESRA